MIGELSEQQIENLIRDQPVGRLACFNQDFVYMVPVSYAYDGQYVYVHSYEGTKLNMMRSNPNVCFEVDNVLDMANWQSVVAWGKFEELTSDETRDEALKILLSRRLPLNSSVTTHLGKIWPFSRSNAREIPGIVFRIAITKKTGRFESGSTTDPIVD